MDAAVLFSQIESDGGSPHVDFWQSPATVCANYPDGLRLHLIQDVIVQANHQIHIPRLTDPQYAHKIQQIQSVQNWLVSLTAEIDRIQSRFSDRFEQAKSLPIADAIPIYERCLADWHTGTLAYERLRIIYTKLKQPSDAIRVCRAYLDMCKAKSKLKLKGGVTPASKKKFAEHIKQLEKAISS